MEKLKQLNKRCAKLLDVIADEYFPLLMVTFVTFICIIEALALIAVFVK